MLDVVKKVFSRSGQTKTTQRGIMAFELTYSTENMSLYIYMGPEHSYYRKSKELPNKVNKMTLPPHIAKEPCVFSEIKSITLHLCAVTIIYVEIKSNRLLPGKLNQYQQNAILLMNLLFCVVKKCVIMQIFGEKNFTIWNYINIYIFCRYIFNFVIILNALTDWITQWKNALYARALV